MTLMRIAFCPQIFFLQRFGGISRYVTEIAKGLKSRGEEPAVFAPVDSNVYLEEAGYPVIEASKLAAIYRRLPAKLRRVSVPYELPPIRWEIQTRMKQWRPDVVHETYYHDRRLGPRGTPAVLTVYDMIHERFPHCFEPTDPTRRKKKLAVAQADAIICISHSTARDLEELLDVPASKISVIHLGWDVIASADDGVADTPRPGKPYFLYVGSRIRYKNFSGFLEAFASSARLRSDFEVVAFGDHPFYEPEIELIRNLGLTDSVRQVMGDDKVLGRLYANARAFVYPSLYEGFGLPPLEAMAHDCPVISSNTSSMPEVIGDAARFFDPSCVESIAEALSEIAYSDTTRSDLIARGRARLKFFSWDACASETLKVYQSLQ